MIRSLLHQRNHRLLQNFMETGMTPNIIYVKIAIEHFSSVVVLQVFRGVHCVLGGQVG